MFVREHASVRRTRDLQCQYFDLPSPRPPSDLLWPPSPHWMICGSRGISPDAAATGSRFSLRLRNDGLGPRRNHHPQVGRGAARLARREGLCWAMAAMLVATLAEMASRCSRYPEQRFSRNVLRSCCEVQAAVGLRSLALLTPRSTCSATDQLRLGANV